MAQKSVAAAPLVDAELATASTGAANNKMSGLIYGCAS